MLRGRADVPLGDAIMSAANQPAMAGHAWSSATALVFATGAIVPLVTATAGLLIARAVGPASYGQVVFFFALFGWVVLLGGMGLNTHAATEIARSLSSDTGLAAAARATQATAIIRFASVGTLLVLSGALALAGQRLPAMALVAGSCALCEAFALNLLQGFGRAALSAALQLGRALLYLTTVVTWARLSPNRVFLAFTAAYALSYAATVVPCRSLYGAWLRMGLPPAERWKGVSRFSGPVYLLNLVTASYGTLGVLVLGRWGRFEDAAMLSIGMAFPGLLTAASTSVATARFYPRFCQLLTTDTVAAHAWFDRFYRYLAALGIAGGAVLLTHAEEILDVVLTDRYRAATDVLVALSATAALVSVGQIALLTLVANHQFRWALAGAFTQFGMLAAGVAAAVAFPTLPISWLGAGHTAATAMALAVWAYALKALPQVPTLHGRRLMLATLAALLTAITMRRIPLPSAPLAAASVLAGCALVVGATTAWVTLGATDRHR